MGAVTAWQIALKVFSFHSDVFWAGQAGLAATRPQEKELLLLVWLQVLYIITAKRRTVYFGAG